MILQKFVFGSGSGQERALYYKGEQIRHEKEHLSISKGACLDFETYFNIFSAEKWKKYTNVENIFLCVELSGKAAVSIFGLTTRNEETVKSLLLETRLCGKDHSSERCPVFALPKEGVIGIEITAEEDCEIYGAYYGTDDLLPVRDVHIGIGICTFCREQYVEHNMKVLTEELLKNPSALSHGHISVCISDNAGTLDQTKIENEQIRIIPNKNLGGVGGFTRTMLEYMQEGTATHILLMDDDGIISTESIERTYMLLTLLKETYWNYIIGGSLLREDMPAVQYECGACWNSGDIVAVNHDFDLSRIDDVVKNECIQKTEYTGWWYACIPAEFIRKNKLPLPFFIHRDDIEYGLRAAGHFIYLNGICVWSEGFENKLPGFLEYYDVRNLAITNAIHDDSYTAKDFKKMLFIQVSSNIGKYRYQYVDLNLKGAVDFLRGFWWFYEKDTLELHGELRKYNYQAEPAEKYIGYHGIEQEDLNACGHPDADVPPKPVMLWRMATLNGHFFPPKRGKTKVVRPFPNIYELYRCREVVYADCTGKAVCVRRSVKELVKAYGKLLRVFHLIDKHYDRAKEGYKQEYRRLTTETFWRKYLEI